MPAKTRKNGWILALGLTLSLIAPSLAEAQQSGLFPNMGVRRGRVPCAAEDPVYKLYRHEYFGYHPTCWRRFPAGWGCPSPEAPNAAAAFKAFPRDTPPPIAPEDGGDGVGPADGGNMGTKPGLPNPTDLPLPDGDASPFDLDNKPKPKPVDSASGATPTANRLPASAVDGLATSPNPITPTNSRNAPTADEPLLSLPEPADSSSSRRALAPVPAPTLPGSGGFSDADPSAYLPPQPKPARRQTLLSNLFGGLGNWRR